MPFVCDAGECHFVRPALPKTTRLQAELAAPHRRTAKQGCASKSDNQSRISGTGECGHITHGHSTPTLAQRLVGGVTCPCSILPTYSIGCAVRRATCTHTRFALYRSIRHSLTASAQSSVCFLTQKRRLSLKRPVKGQRGSNSHCARRLTPKLRLPRTAHQARQYEQITVGGRGGSSPYVEETTFLHNADAYRLSPSVYSPTASLCSNCRDWHAAASALRFGQSHRTHWPRTILFHPQAPTHGKIGAHRLHFEPKACRSTASEPAGLSVRGGTAQQVDGYTPQHDSTPFGFGVAATAGPTLKSRYATPSTLHLRALRFHRASPSPRQKPRER